MNNLKPNKNVEAPPFNTHWEYGTPFRCSFGHKFEWRTTPLGCYQQETCVRCGETRETKSIKKENVCESCNWSNTELLNLGEVNQSSHWVCHSCIKKLYGNYHQLIMAVGSKYPNESRHETALRYINQAENQSDSPTCCNDNIPTLPYRIPQDTPKDDERSYFDKYGN